MLSGILLVSFLVSEYWVNQNLTMKAFYMMPSRAWELAVGGLIALQYENIRKNLNKLSIKLISLITISGILMILIPAYFFDNSTPFPGVNAIWPVLGTSLLICFGEEITMITKVLTSKILIKIGILSYGWYLWHWPLLSFIYNFSVEEPPSFFLNTCAVLVSLVMAQFSLRFIEAPVRYGDFFQKLSPLRTIFITVFTSILIVLGSNYLSDYNQVNHDPIQGKEIYHHINKRTNWKLNCIEDKSCLITKWKARKTIYIWGDSHAWSYTPILDSLKEVELLNIHSLTNKSLLPLFQQDGYFPENQIFYSYDEANRKVFQILQEDKLNKRIILSARWSAYLGGQPISIKDKRGYIIKDSSKTKNIKHFEKELIDTIQKLEELNIEKILIILQFPEFRSDISKCLMKQFGCRTPIQSMETYREDVNLVIQKLTKNKKNIRIIDPLHFFCNETGCNQIFKINEKYYPITYDDDHPSVWAANYLGEKIKDDLNWLVE